MKTRYTTFVLVLFAIVALLVVGLGSSGATAAPNLPAPNWDAGGGISSSADSLQVDTASDMGDRDWTREEMLNAKPYPMELAGNSKPMAAPDVSTLTQGQPYAIEGGVPFGVRPFKADVAAVSFGGISTLGYTYPGPFTRYENFDSYTAFPYRTIGKLFFTQNGKSYVCSASSIGNYAIWTAGHCISDGAGHWSTNVRFVPAYKNGTAPYGQWVAKNTKLRVMTAWHTSADLRYDMGGAALNKLNTYKISQKVGWLGFAWNFPVQQAWFAMGYPAAAPFTGKVQQICASSYAYSDGNMAAPQPSGIGCDQTGGTSGGPWIKNFGTGNYLNGENSYRYTNPNHPSELFSPYFGDAAYSLYTALKADVP